MIDRAPQVVGFAVDLHEHLIKVPAPLAEGAHVADTTPAHVAGKHRTKTIPPEADGLVAQIDTTLEHQVFDVPQAERKPHIHEHDQPDDHGPRVEAPKRAMRLGYRFLWHQCRLAAPQAPCHIGLTVPVILAGDALASRQTSIHP